MTRPKESPVPWASDAAYSHPGKLWDTLPNKVRPGGSVISQGFEPTQRPPGPFLNYALENFGAHLVHLDAPEIQNWYPEAQIAASTFVPDTHATNSITWDSIARVYWMTSFKSTGSKIYYSPDGKTWTYSGFTSPNGTGTGLTSIASSPFGWTVALEQTHGDVHKRDPLANAATWTTTSITNAARLNGILWDSDLNKWVMFGQQLSPVTTNGIFVAAEDIGSQSQTTVPTPAASGSHSEIRWMAVGPGKKVVISNWFDNGIPSTTWHSLTSTAINVAFTDQGDLTPVIGASVPCGLIYDPASDLFALATENGGVYLSPDGVVWSVAPSSPGTTFQPQTFVCLGSLWMVVGLDTAHAFGTTQIYLAYSLDQGDSWGQLPIPCDVAPIQAMALDGRFCILSDGSGTTLATFSHRLSR